MNIDTNLFYLCLAMGAIWLILDEFLGHRLLTQFVALLMPSTVQFNDE